MSIIYFLVKKGEIPKKTQMKKRLAKFSHYTLMRLKNWNCVIQVEVIKTVLSVSEVQHTCQHSHIRQHVADDPMCTKSECRHHTDKDCVRESYLPRTSKRLYEAANT